MNLRVARTMDLQRVGNVVPDHTAKPHTYWLAKSKISIGKNNTNLFRVFGVACEISGQRYAWETKSVYKRDSLIVSELFACQYCWCCCVSGSFLMHYQPNPHCPK